MNATIVTIDAAEYRRLLEQQRVLNTLFENLPVMIYQGTIDPARTMHFVSQGCVYLTGYAPEDLVSGSVTYGSIIHPGDLDRVVERIEEAVRDRAPFSVTYRIRSERGEERWVWEQGHAVFEPADTLHHIEGFMIDVTDRVKAWDMLEERVQDRTRELRTLLDVSRDIAATLDLETLVDRVVAQVRQVVDFTGVTIALREDGVFVRRASRYTTGGYPVEPDGYRYEMGPDHPLLHRLVQGETLVIDDVLDDSDIPREWRRQVGSELDRAVQFIRSWIMVPMSVNEQVVGFITITHNMPNHFSRHDVELIEVIANFVGTAVENARLHGQARKLAAVEERQRLARELHDSVSQALYGISLGAQTARTLLDRDPAAVAQPLDYVLELVDAGLAEMRALIFELRPESLQTEGLVAAIEKQAAAVRTRQRLTIDLTLCAEPGWLTIDQKEALYRIAQESMHNTVKHANARWIGLRLDETPDGLTLEVVDDGIGFNTNGSFPGHLGLISMRERMANIGGILEIDSQPGTGTTVRAMLPRKA